MQKSTADQHRGRVHAVKTEAGPEHPPQRGLSIRKFCDAYDISRSTAYSEIKAGRLLVRKIGRRTIIAIEDAEAWFASCLRS